MFPAEFFVPSTLNTGIGFHNRVKGMFFSLAHFLSIKIMFAPLSNKASAEMKDVSFREYFDFQDNLFIALDTSCSSYFFRDFFFYFFVGLKRGIKHQTEAPATLQTS